MIGSDMAGIRTAEEILGRANDLHDVTVTGKEPYPNYNYIMLSNILQNKMIVEETITDPYEWYKEHDVKLITNDPVADVDRANRNVTTANGIEVAYDKLISATGSKAFIIPVPDSTLPSVIGWRTIDDTGRIVNITKTKKEVIVIGGGLLGLERTRGLLDQDTEVTMLHLVEQLTKIQLDRKVRNMLKANLEKQGMRFEVQTNTAGILGKDDVRGVKSAGEHGIPTDLVVMTVGIRPYAEVVKESGPDVNYGIVINGVVQTSDSNVHAVGECIEHNDRAYGLVTPLYEQGKVLADRLINKETNGYRGPIAFTSLKVSGCGLCGIG